MKKRIPGIRFFIPPLIIFHPRPACLYDLPSQPFTHLLSYYILPQLPETEFSEHNGDSNIFSLHYGKMAL